MNVPTIFAKRPLTQLCLVGSALCLLGVGSCQTKQQFVGTAVCLQCHDGVLAPDQFQFLTSTHYEQGIECEDCHGAGFLHVRAGGRGGVFIDALREPVAEAHLSCIECHAGPTQGFLQSEHFLRETLSCADCHQVHATPTLTAPEEDNSLCLQCHEFLEFPDDAAVNFHTFDFHPVDPTGSGASRCAPCHMPQLEQQMPRGGPRSHSLRTVPPSATVEAFQMGVIPVPPNSCAGVAGCHDPAFPFSGPARDVNDIQLVESLQPLYELIGRIPPKEWGIQP